MDSNTPVPQPTQPAPASQPVPAPEPKPDVPVQEKPQASTGDSAGKKGKMSWLYIAVIAMAVVALVLVGFIAYTEIFKESTPDSSSDEGSEGEGMEEVPLEGVGVEEETMGTFEGDAVTAELPEGWSIVEYFGGDGTDMLTDGVVYTGLTGLEIMTPGEGAAFTLKAVYGIGGVDACKEYYQFADNSTDFYDMIVETSAENGVVPTIVDYTETEYTEFTFLGMSMRRIGQEIFNDNAEDDEYFQAGCGMTHNLWTPEGLSFAADGEEYGTYQWDINDEADEAILLELDAILGSMQAI